MGKAGFARDDFLAIAGCGCAGGFLASALGFYLDAPPGTDLAGAALAWMLAGIRNFRDRTRL